MAAGAFVRISRLRLDLVLEDGRSGCDLAWSATPDQYDVRSTGRVVADEH